MSAVCVCSSSGGRGGGALLTTRADAQLQIHLGARLHVQLHVGARRAPEALQLRGHVVDADAQSGKEVFPVRVRHRRRFDAGALLRRRHRDARQHAAARVGDASDDGSRVDLCEG